MNVLLVQEHPEEVRAIESMLKEAAGETFRIHWMSRLSTALERLRARGLDVVLYDLGFADSQGLDSLTQLQAAFPQVPVVVLTVDDDAARGVEAVQRGAQDVLPKDCLNGGLLARSLRYAFERKRRMSATEAEDRRRAWHSRIWSHGAVPVPAEEDRSEPPAHPASRGAEPDPALEHRYATMVGHYVRAFRMKQAPPRAAIKELALALASVGYGAREIAHLHSRILDRMARRALPDAERAFSADARLALIEVLGRVLDIYGERSRARSSSRDPSRPILLPREGPHG